MPDFDKLVALMADFENSAPYTDDNPFDVKALSGLSEDEFVQMMNAIEAFQQGTVEDTAARIGGDGDHIAFSIAGFMQGLCIGYEYAKREASDVGR